MDFPRKLFAVLVNVMFVTLSLAQEIDIEGHTYCVRQPNNLMWAQTRFYDRNNQALRFEAQDVSNTTQQFCSATGSGTVGSPWVVASIVNLDTNTESNPCGMETFTVIVSNTAVTRYRWRFRAYASAPGEPFVARSFTLYATCDPSDALADGYVTTNEQFKNVPFSVLPQNPKTVTGPNTFATGSPIEVFGSLYPDGVDTPAVLQNAKGYFFKNCYSATSVNMQQDRQLFIDNDGCPIDGAAVSPTGPFVTTSAANAVPIELGTAITATTINGHDTVNLLCETSVCLDDNNNYCDNPCEAHRRGDSKANTRDTGYPYTTSFNVQDTQAQALYPAIQTSLGDPLTIANVGSQIQIVMKGHPYGISSTAAMRQAEGFYVYSCTYSQNKNFNNPVTFIDSQGCPVTNDLFNPSRGFYPNSAVSDSANNIYGLTSGDVTLKEVAGKRLWIRCSTGICTSDQHNFCRVGRCDATDNQPGEYANLGYLGLEFVLSIISPNIPSIGIENTDKNGNPVDDNTSVFTGEGINFKVISVPGGTGAAGGLLQGVAGTFVHTCDTTITTPSGSEETYRTIDNNGCQVDGTPIAFSQECIDTTEVPGVPPYTTDCGQMSSSQAGEVSTSCRIGVCPDADNPFCINRCAAGPLGPNTQAYNLDNVATAPSKFNAKQKPEGNTARTSENIRNMIIAATVAGPVAVVVVVSAISYMSLNYQKKGKVC